MIFDAGVFIAVESPSQRRAVLEIVDRLQVEGTMLATNEAALAQAWREPARQVHMTRLVRAIDVYPFGDPRVIGQRCARTGTSDVVDASLAVLADQLDVKVLTTDAADFRRLGVNAAEL
ncbi:MAG: hypothetical protein OXM54_00150 [Acidimicrobiaceae bacterium]|nr:hypothetical protein [Acidimicrobiaceae bacterium]MDE0320113.1 hypothetical protein [Acidimicrobiaceae bacterium]